MKRLLSHYKCRESKTVRALFSTAIELKSLFFHGSFRCTRGFTHTLTHLRVVRPFFPFPFALPAPPAPSARTLAGLTLNASPPSSLTE